MIFSSLLLIFLKLLVPVCSGLPGKCGVYLTSCVDIVWGSTESPGSQALHRQMAVGAVLMYFRSLPRMAPNMGSRNIL